MMLLLILEVYIFVLSERLQHAFVLIFWICQVLGLLYLKLNEVVPVAKIKQLLEY